jgi:DNA-binding transcriptional LysR family regulator
MTADMLETIVGAELRSGRLQQILPEYARLKSMFALLPWRRYLSVRVRTFVDHLSGYFGAEPERGQFN